MFGVKSKDAPNKWMATTGIVLCIIGLVLTIINASIGVYMGATGASLLDGVLFTLYIAKY
ncbi:MAG: hypothetical protein AAB509_00605 [Patescibacteria group bacterium]